jgi:hypothetical protein
MPKKELFGLLVLFALQILLSVFGDFIFLPRANSLVLFALSLYLPYRAFEILKQDKEQGSIGVNIPQNNRLFPIVAGIFGVGLVFLSIPALNKLWLRYSDPGKQSDVLPQLKAQADLFFSGQFPYIPIETIGHRPFPVYLPLHWAPFQLVNIFGTDVRWPSFIFFAIGVGVSSYFLSKRFLLGSKLQTLLLVLLLAMPWWGFVRFGWHDLALSAEGIVALYYLLLATGLAVKNKWLVFLGILGALLSRYSLLFWLPLMFLLMWFYEKRSTTYLLSGSILLSVLCLFVVPFLAKDPTILTKMAEHYAGCDERSWVRPDEYTFRDGLSLNIHLREWLPGEPATSLPFAHWPQIFVQLLFLVGGLAYYRKEGYKHFDIYTYGLILLAVMPMMLYLFSPMLFRYYMLVPLAVSAVLCWRTITALQTIHAKN